MGAEWVWLGHCWVEVLGPRGKEGVGKLSCEEGVVEGGLLCCWA